ncbi:MAG: radical SAM protein [Acidithiobacillus sp.]|jgi:organic radical activating enzyme|uniref:radical SAM protein n=1 Tax=Acidithiobacillus sp. TaxID=1872118 RepID=UPI00356101F9
MSEITFEITDYCPNKCKYCSSDAFNTNEQSHFMSFELFLNILGTRQFDIIHLSGGEPLSNPDFYAILMTCYHHAKDVIVHTNALRHIAFNLGVIDNIYLEAYTTITTDVDKVHILKRIKQGREKKRPEVHFSKNWTEDCSCKHRVVKSDGTIVKSPCSKFEEVKDEDNIQMK